MEGLYQKELLFKGLRFCDPVIALVKLDHFCEQEVESYAKRPHRIFLNHWAAQHVEDRTCETVLVTADRSLNIGRAWASVTQHENQPAWLLEKFLFNLLQTRDQKGFCEHQGPREDGVKRKSDKSNDRQRLGLL